ncbi:MAG: glycosyltransferase [Bacteroidaceae bacterium]|nr:glycosyltransferase [Bacteroidaceae bacterium]
MNNIDIIIVSSYLVIWFISIYQLYWDGQIKRKVKKACQKGYLNTSLPKFSIVITAHEQANELHKHLPLILEQDYTQEFEVIVVDINSTDNTCQMLERLQLRYSNLHVVSVPTTARNISTIRLALTLGIRAASNDWIVFTQADCFPASPNWLTQMGMSCMKKKTTEIVLGYSHYASAKGWTGMCNRFYRTWQQMLNLPYAEKHGAYSADGTNLCYRRSLFLRHKGFAEHTDLLLGAIEIMINQNSTKHNTSICYHPDAFILQKYSRYSQVLQQGALFFTETRKHFRHYLCHHAKLCWRMLLIWCFTIMTIAGFLFEYFMGNQIYAYSILGIWFIHTIVRAICYKKIMNTLRESSFSPFTLLLLHLPVWWNMKAWLQWLFTKKQVFLKKYI